MTTTPPEDPHEDPNLGAGDHEPTVNIGGSEPTAPLEPPPVGPDPAAQYPPPPPPPGAGYPPPGSGYPPPGQGPAQPYAAQYQAPYGIDPTTGLPFSDKSKLVAGLLQILIPLGIGRFYTGHTGLGVAQLLVTIFTCGVGAIWPFVDGIIMLVSDSRDAMGRPLRS